MNPRPILGYTDTETVKLDFDNVSFKTARYWAYRTMEKFKLGGFIILKSSENNYHVLFDKTVSWKRKMKIVGWVSLLSLNPKLLKWFVMQCIKESSTLRVSPKKDKPSPRIVYRYGKQDGQIQSFLELRKKIKNMITRLALNQCSREETTRAGA